MNNSISKLTNAEVACVSGGSPAWETLISPTEAVVACIIVSVLVCCFVRSYAQIIAGANGHDPDVVIVVNAIAEMPLAR